MATDVAITGASGLVGGHLAARLVADGARVRAIVRSHEAAAKAGERGAEPTIVDLFDHDGLRDAFWGAEVVYHVAGVNETCSRDPGAMDRVNIDGTRAVIEAAADAGVGRVVYTSSAAVIGEPQGTIGHEETAHSGIFLSAYARSKKLAEDVAFETAGRRDVDLVAVLPSSVQGPGRATGSARILLYVLTADRPRLVDTKVSIIDIDDCTAGHIAAADKGRRGERYLLSGATLSVAEAVSLAERITGDSIEPRWLSESMVRTWGGLGARLAKLFRPSAEICPELVATLLHGHRFDGSRAERDLGITYTPIEDTFRRTIEWFRSEGRI